MSLLIAGPRNCGKSELAETVALTAAKGAKILYLATLIESPENRERIRRHKKRRSRQWKTVYVNQFSEIASQYNVMEGVCLLDGLDAVMGDFFRLNRADQRSPDRIVASAIRIVASARPDLIIVLGFHKTMPTLVPRALQRLVENGWGTLGPTIRDCITTVFLQTDDAVNWPIVLDQVLRPGVDR